MNEQAEQAVDPVSDGVALLIQRMKSHPEEFDVERGKWHHVLQVVHERVHHIYKTSGVIPDAWMSDHEVRSIWSAYKELKQKKFHSWVMEKLLVNEEDSTSLGVKLKSPSRLLTTAEINRQALDILGQEIDKSYGATLPPGSWQTVHADIADTPLATALKQKLEAMWKK